jgi:signal transduction histidine kinase
MRQTEQMATTGRAAQIHGAGERSDSASHKEDGTERKRVETVVETLAALRSQSETLSEVAHDARNMVTALGLYCDLLEEPGVLTPPYSHYGNELRLVAVASRRLVEKLVALDAHADRAKDTHPFPRLDSGRWPLLTVASKNLERSGGWNPNDRLLPQNAGRNRHWDLLPPVPVSNLAAELLANRNLLSALAGPSIVLTVDADGGALPVRLTGEDLTRALVNLVKNAAEAMPKGGRIHIGLRECPAAQGTAECLALAVEDNGPGIAEEALEKIFTSGYTTCGESEEENGHWRLGHRGLGLAITRSIIEGAGGRISAANLKQGGACFEIELPVRKASF